MSYTNLQILHLPSFIVPPKTQIAALNVPFKSSHSADFPNISRLVLLSVVDFCLSLICSFVRLDPSSVISKIYLLQKLAIESGMFSNSGL